MLQTRQTAGPAVKVCSTMWKSDDGSDTVAETIKKETKDASIRYCTLLPFHSVKGVSKMNRRTFLRSGIVVVSATASGLLLSRQMLSVARAATLQDNWRWCNKCQGMFFAGNGTNGYCPAGGEHNMEGSANLALYFYDNDNSQDNWRWCMKCQGLYFAGNGTDGVCPAGGSHDPSKSGDYGLPQNRQPYTGEQNDWFWCHQCQGLYYGGYNDGACPANNGYAHDHTGSGNYVVVINPQSNSNNGSNSGSGTALDIRITDVISSDPVDIRFDVVARGFGGVPLLLYAFFAYNNNGQRGDFVRDNNGSYVSAHTTLTPADDSRRWTNLSLRVARQRLPDGNIPLFAEVQGERDGDSQFSYFSNDFPFITPMFQ